MEKELSDLIKRVREKFDLILAHCSWDQEVGYAIHSKGFFTALSRLLPVRVIDSYPVDGSNINEEQKKLTITQEEVDKLHINPGRVLHIVNLTSDHSAFCQEYSGPKIAYNIWESTVQADHCFKQFLEFDQMWVPSKWQRDCTVAQGYPADRVFTVQSGVDADYFKPMDGPYQLPSVFTFLMLGKWYARKNPKEIIQSFLDEFKGENVKLAVNIDTPPWWVDDGIKSTKDRLEKYGLVSNQIEIINFESKEKYLRRLQMGHAYVSCARAEGWNLPLIEAMACGIPAICSNYGAQLDYAEGVAHLVNVKGLVPMKFYYDRPDGFGLEADVDFGHLRSVMRNVYENFAFCKRKAMKDSVTVREKWSFDNAAGRAVEVISEFKPKKMVELQSKKLKVLLLAEHMSTGGMPQYTLGCARKLVADGNDVTVVEFSDFSPVYVVQKKQFSGLCNYVTLYGDNDQKLNSLKELVAGLSPDIIHVQDFPETWVPLPVAEWLYRNDRGYRIIETSHYHGFDKQKKICWPDGFAFVGVFHANQYKDADIPYAVVEYPIERHERPDRTEALKKLGLDPLKKHVLNIGIFAPWKSQGDIFEIARVMPDVQFHFVGNQADNFAEYRDRIMAGKPGNCVIWGERADVDGFYSSMDLLLFPSTRETNPLVPREAISWGMPVLINDLPVYCGFFDNFPGVELLSKDIASRVRETRNMLSFGHLFKRGLAADTMLESLNKIYHETLGKPIQKNSFQAKRLVESTPALLANHKFSVIGDAGKKIVVDFDTTSVEDINKEAFLFGYGFQEIFTNRTYDNDHCSVEKGDLVVDIGAHVGLFSRYAAEKGADKIYSFEAEPLNFSCLIDNAPENCSPFNLAITNRMGFCELFTDRCTGGHSLYNCDINKTKTGKSIQVQCATLESLFESGLFDHIDFLKIDVEGAEREIMSRLPKKYFEKIKKIAIEYHHMVHDFDKSHEDIIVMMADTHASKVVSLGEQMSMIYFLRKDLLAEKPKEDLVFKPIKDKLMVSFYDGVKVEITGQSGAEYKTDFIDADTGVCIFSAPIFPNHWLAPNIKYQMNWLIRVSRKDGSLVHEERFDPKGKKVVVHIDSRSMGDILAWVPYAEEFRKKWDCEVFVDTFSNHFFTGRYPNLKFFEPTGPAPEDVYARFSIGVRDDNADHNRNNWRTVPLQKVASDYLGLEYREIRPEIRNVAPAQDLPSPYVTIAEHSTMMNKYWLYPDGWQTVVDFLNDRGYSVVAVSREKTALKNIIDRTDRPIEETMANMAGARLHIGTSAGPSWMAWALGVKNIVIAGSSERWEEMQDCIRIINEDVCHGCGNDPKHFYDRGNRFWCPRDKKFECSRSILPATVVEEIKKILPEVEVEEKKAVDIQLGLPTLRISIPAAATRTEANSLSRLNLNGVLNRLPKDPIIVEIGMARQMVDQGDGLSTLAFAKFIENGSGPNGLFYSVDVNPGAIKVTKDLFDANGVKGNRSMLILSDGVDFFRNIKGSVLSGVIDLLYLDAFDWVPGDNKSQLWHMECFKVAEEHLSKDAFVLIDDVIDLATFRGKGEILIPYMLKNGYRIVEGGYQVLLQKTG